MEVIKHGNTYKEIECPKCGAILSYCKADIKVDRYGNNCCFHDKQCITEIYVICPECSRKIILKCLKDEKEQKI